jgi:long-chain acyl-CoA synthetase
MENTINEVFKNRVKHYGDRLAVEKNNRGVWETASWNEYYERSRFTGLGLFELGVRHGDRVAILSENRLEWIYTDMGGLGIGACVVAIYATVPARDVAYVLENSDAKVVVVENREQLEKVLAVQHGCPQLEKIVVVEPVDCPLDGNRIIGFNDMLRLGRQKQDQQPELFERMAAAVSPEDLLTIQYTSGSTGVPKGAMLTHGNIMSAIRSLTSVSPPFADETDHVVGFLPLSHVFERIPVHYYVMYTGVTKSYAGSMETLVADIQEKKPTILFAVPRVHEKIYQKMQLAVKEKPPVVQKLFAWAQQVGNRISQCRENNVPPPLALRWKHKLAYALVFKKLQHALGGQVRWMCAAGGPIAKEIVHFFNAAGIFVIEGYGLSEVSGGATLSNLNDFCPGSVGRPLPGLDIKIAEDGEILVKGDPVTRGYWKMEDNTLASFTEEGYFKTGDIGHFNEKGLLFITDRKKNLIITSGGKNIAPQKIETLFKNNPLFSHVMVIGDARKYLSALFVLDLDVAAQMAKSHRIGFESKEALLDHPAFRVIIDQIVDENNKQLARVETIKKYRIIKQEFSIDGGELTVSMKLKKNMILKKYAAEIESMYSE